MGDITSEAVRARGVSVTIKYGKGFEDTWAGFTGLPSEVREDIIEFFALDRASVTDVSLSGIVNLATGVAHATSTARTQLGAVEIKGKPAASESPFRDDAVGSHDDPWAGIEGEAGQPSDPHAALRSQIDAQQSIESLKKLWAENQQAFSDDSTLMDAYRARGSALKAAAAA